ncbi:hypothetical protein PPERSA_08256 [Pseudocohnilembus persalinus]|uniref:Post-transcriptional regulator MKT1 C-terminal domain-containing protein n=1 Tax=Pseudocohnilembus persalinus TaxID=266149 RepID=A0A0V0QFZ9_PSEPJ|nr:hypothetical protein PPERSA_08256 [Pseudocohnilembus persalinus]|eukprot:KRX01155.1 hypothetical protein PPERSA_08256 [Pseudocohnilembus persalinus]
MPFLDIRGQVIFQNHDKLQEYLGFKVPDSFMILQNLGIISNELLAVFTQNKTLCQYPIADSYELRSMFEYSLDSGFNFDQYFQQSISVIRPLLNKKLNEQQFLLGKYFENLHSQSYNCVIKNNGSSHGYEKRDTIKKQKKFSIDVSSNIKSIQKIKKGSVDLYHQDIQTFKTGKSNSNEAQAQQLINLNNGMNFNQQNLNDTEIFQEFIPIDDEQSLFMTLKLNFLSNLQYIYPQTKKSSLLAKSLKQESNIQFEEELIILVQILSNINNNILYESFKQYKQEAKNTCNMLEFGLKTYNVNSLNENENYKFIVIIQRVMSFIVMDYDNWEQQFYSFECAQFLSIIMEVQKQLDWSFQIIYLTMFIQNKNSDMINIFYKLKSFMPFKKQYNCAFSILLGQLLTEQQTITQINKKYLDFQQCLKQGMQLWQCVIDFLTNYASHQNSSSHSKELLQKFKDADVFLKGKINNLDG